MVRMGYHVKPTKRESHHNEIERQGTFSDYTCVKK